ncbi:MAG: hypothetical protein MR555_05550 [Spirochaetia bacterium]|nr:hypothetical protein [Spirochaetia bacterium]
MTFRKFTNLLLSVLLAFAFISCNQVAGGIEDGASMASLKISVENEPLNRSIMANNTEIFKVGDAGITYILSGVSKESGKTLASQPVTLTKKSADHYTFNETIYLAAKKWVLTLVAYTTYNGENDPGNIAVLKGTSLVDLTNGTGTANFVMGIKGLTTTAQATITAKVPDSDKLTTSYTIGIYNKRDGSKITEQNNPITSATEFNINYTADPVEPGNYIFKVIFRNQDKVVGSYFDTIIFEPGVNFTKDLGTIDVIGKKPAIPKNLKVFLINDSETLDTYNVRVTWDRSALTANYELELITFNTDGNSSDTKTSKIYGIKSMDEAEPALEDFVGSSIIGPDSSAMLSCDNSCILTLQLGKVYEIRLRARNYIAASQWQERIDADDEIGFTGFKVGDDENPIRINRLRIDYNLSSGTLKEFTGGAENTIYTQKYAEYKSWNSTLTNTELLSISETEPQDGYTLKFGDSQFTGWYENSTENAAKVENFTYKNLSVVAKYGQALTSDITNAEREKDLERSDIKIYSKNDGTTSTEVTADALSGSYIIPRLDDNGDLNTIKVAVNTTGEKYTDVKFTLTSTISQITYNFTTNELVDSKTTEFTTSEFDAGKYQLTVIANTKNSTNREQQFIIEIQ